ncbi:MAG: hypothetical protein H7Y31_00615 [Chitinophagaceae bacterium]|nr:hypothetical protein [Chitinophagaceae bacterium]
MQKKALGVLLAAAAAYGYYRYSKMSPDQKKDLLSKGKKLVKDNFGTGLEGLFGDKTPKSNPAM